MARAPIVVTAKIKNLGAVKDKLEAYAAALKSVSLDTNMRVGEALAKQARGLAPVRTGALRDSIKVEPMEGEAEEYAVKVFSSDFKAPFIEFGTKGFEAGGVYKGAGVQIPAQAARPFMRPAFRVVRKRVKGYVQRGAKRAKAMI